MHVLALFEPGTKWTAIFYVIGVACFVMAAFAAPATTKRVGGSIGLIGLGLAFWLWPTMWSSVRIAF